jgi:hypothetical protein
MLSPPRRRCFFPRFSASSAALNCMSWGQLSQTK